MVSLETVANDFAIIVQAHGRTVVARRRGQADNLIPILPKGRERAERRQRRERRHRSRTGYDGANARPQFSKSRGPGVRPKNEWFFVLHFAMNYAASFAAGCIPKEMFRVRCSGFRAQDEGFSGQRVKDALRII